MPSLTPITEPNITSATVVDCAPGSDALKELHSDMTIPEISVIIPVYNEEDNLELLYDKLLISLTGTKRTWEVILIDDGSKDASFAELQKLAANDKRVKVVRFVRNYGQTAALAAGIEHAQGKVIIPMDADL